MKTSHYNNIKKIEFDLSSSCNSYCPSCARYTIQNNELYLNPYLNFNQNISVAVIENIFSSQSISDTVKVDLVGSVGDALAHPKIIDIIDVIYQHRPDCEINIHTNGGLGNPALYKKLATHLKRPSNVSFSVDGLADTNHLYRIGVIWERVIENIKAFNAAGGKSTWQFVEFEWNRHQTNDARRLAEQLGCDEFVVRYDRMSESERAEYNIAAQRINQKKTAKRTNREPLVNKKSSYAPVTDKCVSTQSIYVNSDSRVVPCCMFNTALIDPFLLDEINNFMYTDDNNWNDLSVRTFDDIINNEWWDKLVSSFGSPVNSTTTCLMSCSRLA